MSSRRHLTVAIAASVMGMVLLSIPLLGAPSGAVSAQKAPSLVSLTVGAPSGYHTDPTDQTSGGRTGRININEASSADCVPTSLSPAQWVGSVLRYFDKDAARPQSYLILCVTQMRTANEAAAVRTRLLTLIGSSAIRLKDIPGTYLHATGPAEELFFAKGVYFVRVVSTDLVGSAMGLTLGQNLTAREYARLPK
jgi:hypothetical protein